MIKKNYTFQKEYKKNHSILKFTFTGDSLKANLNREEIENLVDNCFNKMTSYTDVVKIVEWIKTNFNDFTNDSLEVTKWENNSEICVEYKNKRLIYFETIEALNAKKYLNVIYSIPFKIKTYVSGKNISKEEDTFEIYKEKIKDVMQLISKFENADAIKLQERDKTIWEFYKLFYEENPDFSSGDICIKIQTRSYSF